MVTSGRPMRRPSRQPEELYLTVILVTTVAACAADPRRGASTNGLRDEVSGVHLRSSAGTTHHDFERKSASVLDASASANKTVWTPAAPLPRRAAATSKCKFRARGRGEERLHDEAPPV